MSYRLLDSQRILDTLDRLCQRIEERFPKAGLLSVARELQALARDCVQEEQSLALPNWPLRAAAGLFIAVIVVASGVLFVGLWTADVPRGFASIVDYVTVIEAAVNDLVFLGIAVFFFVTIEGRLKRRRALKYLHQLRSIAHVVDMHQLTKDPELTFAAHRATPASPTRLMTPAELGRYLDYCSELLSVTSKVAALFVQRFQDPVVLAAVNDVETLTTGLSRKIWQKISLLSDRPSG